MSGPVKHAKTSTKPSLEESEFRYRRLFEAAQVGIPILDAKTGRIDDVNPHLIKLLGYSRAELLEKKLWEVGALKDAMASGAGFKALQEEEYIRYEDLPLKTKHGTLIEVEFVSNVYVVGGKKVIQCDIRDITEHRRIIAALQGSEKKYYDLVNQSPDGMFILELSGRMITTNDSMCRELGFSKEEFLAKKLWDLVPKQYLGPYRASLKRIFEGRSIREASEYAIRGKNGELHYVEIISAPHYAGKDVIGYYGIARDLTARLRAQEELASLATFPSENPGPVLRLGGNGVVLYANAASEALLAMWKCIVGGPAPKVWCELAAETLASGESKTVDVACEGKLYSMYATPIAARGYLNLYGRDVTESKRAEAALLAAGGRFQSLVENAPDAIAVISADGTLAYDSPAGPRLLGYAADELLGQDVLALVHPDDIGTVTSLIQKILQDASVLADGLFRFRHKDGSWRWMEATGKNLLGDSSVAGLVINYRDITDRKQAEGKLRDSENQFQSLAESMPQIVWVTEPDGSNIYFNQQWVDYTGLTLEESRGSGWNKPFHPDDQQRAWDAWQNAVTNDDVYSIEARLRRADGVYEWWLVRGVPQLDAQGNILKWFGTCTNINELKLSYEALRTSHQLLDGILNAIPVRVFWKDAQGVYLGCNAEFARDLGYSDPHDIIGKQDSELGRAEGGESYRKDDLEVTTSGQPRLNIEESMAINGGTVLTLLTSKIPLKGAQGEIRGVLGTYVDISERKRAENEFREQLDELRRWQSATVGRETRILDLKHEVNQLLTGAGQPPRYPSAESDQ